MIQCILVLVATFFLPSNSLAERAPSSLDGLLGVTLLTTKISDVQQKFGKSSLFEIPFGHHEKGLCYKSKSGINIVFSTSPLGRKTYVDGIRISNNKSDYPCTLVDIDIPSCFGGICLNQSVEEIKKITGKSFTKTDYGVEQWTTGYSYSRRLSREEIISMFGQEAPLIYMADISQTLWVRVGDNGAHTIGTYKMETY